MAGESADEVPEVKCSTSSSRGNWKPKPIPPDRRRFTNCIFHKRGSCRYGFKCWYRHSDPIDKFGPARPEGDGSSTEDSAPDPDTSKLCFNFTFAECRSGDSCPYVHGDVCQLCGFPLLHPTDEQQRLQHTQQCDAYIEQDMDFCFRLHNSKDKKCAICMEVVYEKPLFTHQRFGILEKCNHVFCLDCIRLWRRKRTDEGQNLSVKNCPVCRVQSDFVVPSEYWFESEEEKQQIISEFKSAVGEKACKYFKQGEGLCPFGGQCFYKHALPDGTRVSLPLRGRRARVQRDDVAVQTLMAAFLV